MILVTFIKMQSSELLYLLLLPPGMLYLHLCISLQCQLRCHFAHVFPLPPQAEVGPQSLSSHPVSMFIELIATAYFVHFVSLLIMGEEFNLFPFVSSLNLDDCPTHSRCSRNICCAIKLESLREYFNVIFDEDPS